MEENMAKLLYTGTIAGVSFEPAKTNLREAVEYFQNQMEDPKWRPQCKLNHESTNQYDRNAIRVSIGDARTSFEVGYLPKTHNTQVLEAGIDKVKAEVVDFSMYEDEVVGVEVLVEAQ